MWHIIGSIGTGKTVIRHWLQLEPINPSLITYNAEPQNDDSDGYPSTSVQSNGMDTTIKMFYPWFDGSKWDEMKYVPLLVIASENGRLLQEHVDLLERFRKHPCCVVLVNKMPNISIPYYEHATNDLRFWIKQHFDHEPLIYFFPFTKDVKQLPSTIDEVRKGISRVAPQRFRPKKTWSQKQDIVCQQQQAAKFALEGQQMEEQSDLFKQQQKESE